MVCFTQSGKNGAIGEDVVRVVVEENKQETGDVMDMVVKETVKKQGPVTQSHVRNNYWFYNVTLFCYICLL